MTTAYRVASKYRRIMASEESNRMAAIEQASKALNDALDEDPNAVRVGDLVIDEDTGEILEMPDGQADRMEALVMRYRQAKQNIEGWEQAGVLLKLAIGRLLDQQGVRSFSTPYGKPTWMAGRVTETADTVAVKLFMAANGMGLEERMDIYDAAVKTFDPKKLREVIGSDCNDLITVKNGNAYVQVNPPTQAPPVIERVS